jgi:hypothetical protein
MNKSYHTCSLLPKKERKKEKKNNLFVNYSFFFFLFVLIQTNRDSHPLHQTVQTFSSCALNWSASQSTEVEEKQRQRK